MINRKQIKGSVLALLVLVMVSIGCSSDDDVQPQIETPVENKAPVISAQTFTAKEDVADDTVIGTVTATDPESKALTFTLTQNSEDLFELTTTGELSLAADKKLDFETTSSYTLTVEVSDGTNKTSAEITIAVENVAEAFITIWKTTESNEVISIGLNEDFIYDFTIDWGDGAVESGQTTPPSHTYTTAGTYIVSITGTFPAIRMNYRDNTSHKLQTLEQWGDNKWESFDTAFAGCMNMTYNATDIPNLSKTTDMTDMFAYCLKFDGDLNNWDVSTITNMKQVFSDCSEFNSDLNNWDVSNVTDMSSMFYKATSFNRDLNQWNVSNVVDMVGMFYGDTSFNGDVSQWDVSNVTNMGYMFVGATSFNGDLSQWDISKVTSMFSMLSNTKLSTVNYDALLNKWSSLPNVQSNVKFGVQGLTYCDAGIAGRTSLINDKGWTITGDRECPR